MEARFAELTQQLPGARQHLSASERRREEASQSRFAAEGHRTEIARRLASVRVELGKVEGDLALAAERLTNAQHAPDTRRRGAEPDGAPRAARADRAGVGGRRSERRGRGARAHPRRAGGSRGGRGRCAAAARGEAGAGPAAGAGTPPGDADAAVARGRARGARERAGLAPRARHAGSHPSIGAAARARRGRAPPRSGRGTGGLPEPRIEAGGRSRPSARGILVAETREREALTPGRATPRRGVAGADDRPPTRTRGAGARSCRARARGRRAPSGARSVRAAVYWDL